MNLIWLNSIKDKESIQLLKLTEIELLLNNDGGNINGVFDYKQNCDKLYQLDIEE